MHKLLRGALAGTLATLPMTLAMTRLFRKLPEPQRYPLPPRLIMENLSSRTSLGSAPSDARLTEMTLAAHFAYGAATGALFPYLERQHQPDWLTGAMYGVGVWAASYLGWIPAAHILSPATQHPARRNALMLAAHLVWGSALAGSSALLRGARHMSGHASLHMPGFHRAPSPSSPSSDLQRERPHGTRGRARPGRLHA